MSTNPKKEKLAALTVEQLKPKAKRLGVKLTNPSGNAKTKAQLITAIIKAEDKKPAAKKPAAKKPAAKRSAVKKSLAPVVGASKRRDAKRQALPPGRRVSKGGKVYYERRSNRADAAQGAAKGQMLGQSNKIKINRWTLGTQLYQMDTDMTVNELEVVIVDQTFINGYLTNSYYYEEAPYVYRIEGILYSTCYECIIKYKIKFLINEREAFVDTMKYNIRTLKELLKK